MKTPETEVLTGNIIMTRIRLARNVYGAPFSLTDMDLSEEIIKNVSRSLVNFGSFDLYRMAELSEERAESMKEKHLISSRLMKNPAGAALIDENEGVSVMIGEEDVLREQCFKKGLCLYEVYDKLDRIDDEICKNTDIAFDKDLGFLTECPTNLGTGLRASVMLHLPFLEASKELGAISDSISKIGFTVRGMYGEGTKAEASLYQISNEVTLGISEKNAIDNLKIIANQLIEKEREERKSADKIKIADISNRALAILKSARILSSSELIKLISEIKIGVSTGEINVKNELLTSILFENQPYTIMCKYGNLSSKERDEKRAELIRERIKDI